MGCDFCEKNFFFKWIIDFSKISQFWLLFGVLFLSVGCCLVFFCWDLERNFLVLSLTQNIFGNSADSPESTQHLDWVNWVLLVPKIVSGIELSMKGLRRIRLSQVVVDSRIPWSMMMSLILLLVFSLCSSFFFHSDFRWSKWRINENWSY